MAAVFIRPSEEKDKAWVQQFIIKEWGANKIVTNGSVYTPSLLSGLLAIQEEQPVGLLTYKIEENICKIVTLNAIEMHKGIGTALIEEIIRLSKEKGLQEISVITTNDNIDGLRFYQKRGFAIKVVRINELENSRKLKPEIPLLGNYDIPLRDEIELILPI